MLRERVERKERARTGAWGTSSCRDQAEEEGLVTAYHGAPSANRICGVMSPREESISSVFLPHQEVEAYEGGKIACGVGHL